jgi:hypothetical protein
VLSGGFKRSGLFGLIGVVVVIAAVALIALNADSGDPNPKGTMALIFGVIAVFVVILFVLQRSDLERVAGSDAKTVTRAVAEGGARIENPTTMEEQQLWAALAVKPIDDEAVKARGPTRRLRWPGRRMPVSSLARVRSTPAPCALAWPSRLSRRARPARRPREWRPRAPDRPARPLAAARRAARWRDRDAPAARPRRASRARDRHGCDRR